MDWFTVQGSLRDHEKWVGLSPVGRGAWITLMTIGHGQPGSKRWTLGSREHVEVLLRREGFGDPAAVVEELIDARLVHVKRGILSMHDASVHQRFLSDTPGRVNERVRRHRAKPREAETAGNGEKRQETARNGDRTERTDGTERTGSPGGNGVPPDLLTNDLYRLFRALTHEAPDRRHKKWMDDLTVQEGEDAVGRKAVADVMRQWTPEKGDLLGWTSAKLRGGKA